MRRCSTPPPGSRCSSQQASEEVASARSALRKPCSFFPALPFIFEVVTCWAVGAVGKSCASSLGEAACCSHKRPLPLGPCNPLCRRIRPFPPGPYQILWATVTDGKNGWHPVAPRHRLLRRALPLHSLELQNLQAMIQHIYSHWGNF